MSCEEAVGEDTGTCCSLAALPPDVLLKMLRQLPFSVRLWECSLVCRAWRAAAAAATDELQIITPTGFAQPPAFTSWMHRHGSRLRALQLTTRASGMLPHEVVLPFQQLQNLTQLWGTSAVICASNGDPAVTTAADTCSSSSSSSSTGDNPLSALTSLAELSLSYSSVRGAPGAPRGSMQLQDLTVLGASLTSLRLAHVTSRDWDETNTDLAAALSQLPLLRCLELCHSNFGDTSLCAVSSLTHLQALVLENLSKAGAAVYAALPASLTRLDLVSTKRGLAMTGSSCSHLAALSQLLHLKLQQIRGVELTALATLSQLTHLHLQGSKKEADQPLQPLMAVVAGLQQLLHLHLSVTNYAPSDLTVEPLTQWAALVAITQLTYLHYDGTAWQHGDVFSSSRPLPLLQVLELDSSHKWRGKLCGSCMDHQGLQLLVQCCPGLQQLGLGAAVGENADLSPLLQLKYLTSLSVCMSLCISTVQCLVAFNGLRSLTFHTEILPDLALMWLAKLQHLVSLDIICCAGRSEFDEFGPELQRHALMRSPAQMSLRQVTVNRGTDKMVWEQLLELCNSSAACLAVMLEQEKAVSQGAQQLAALLQQELQETRQQLLQARSECRQALMQLTQAKAAAAAFGSDSAH